MFNRIKDAILLKGFSQCDACVKSVAQQIRITAWVICAVELFGHKSAGILLIIAPTWIILNILSYILVSGLDKFKGDEE